MHSIDVVMDFEKKRIQSGDWFPLRDSSPTQNGKKEEGESPTHFVYMKLYELRVEGMTCGGCVKTVENELMGIPGAKSAVCNLLTGSGVLMIDGSSSSSIKEIEGAVTGKFKCTVMSERISTGNAEEDSKVEESAHLHLRLNSKLDKPSFTSLMESIRRLSDVKAAVSSGNNKYVRVSYDPTRVGGRTLLSRIEDEHSTILSHNAMSDTMFDNLSTTEDKKELKRCFFSAVPFTFIVVSLMFFIPNNLIPMLEKYIIPGITTRMLLSLICTIPVQYIFGLRIHKSAYKAVESLTADMSLLISTSTNIAFVYSAAVMMYSCILSVKHTENISPPVVYFETSAILITVSLMGTLLESYAKSKTTEYLNSLSNLQPDRCTLLNKVLQTNEYEETVGDTNDEGAALMEGGTYSEVERQTNEYTECQISTELIEIGDSLIVYPGGVIPADGIKRNTGVAHVDESMLTGESKPVKKRESSVLLGGSVCQSGSITIEIKKVGSASILGQMIQLVSGSRNEKKMKVQRIADVIASFFIPTVIVLSCGCWIVWTILVACKVIIPTDDEGVELAGEEKILFVLKFGMAVMAIACPCAIGLASPTAIMVAMGVAAKHGILLKGGTTLENAHKMDIIVLDKTGTVAEGYLKVCGAAIVGDCMSALEDKLSSVYARMATNEMNGDTSASASIRVKQETNENVFGGEAEYFTVGCNDLNGRAATATKAFWWLLGCAESGSEHPLGKAIVKFIKEKVDIPPLLIPSDFENVVGKGVRCKVLGLDIGVGKCSFNKMRGITPSTVAVQVASNWNTSIELSSSLLTEEKLSEAFQWDDKFSLDSLTAFPGVLHQVEQWASVHQTAGHTVVAVYMEQLFCGAIVLEDNIREEAAGVIAGFKKLGKDVWMCSGDNETTVLSIGGKVGIEENQIVAEALPSHKVELVKSLQLKGKVCMIGDGINDSPALAQSDCGVAVGLGSYLTASSADVILVNSSLKSIHTLFKLAKFTVLVIWFNVFWASLFNAIAIPIAAGCFYNWGVTLDPPLAGTIMGLSSTLVVLMSLTLKFFTPPRTL